ncbi:MATE family efflux transporter [Oricola sp.]|uniref:MATE family efflux transporter n=1 Tax=Oricola sp. TaxID=1979950 RepID=UPI0035157E56
MTRSADEPRNRFLSDPLPGLYVRTAAPIIFVMATNGLLTVIDALFLGTFVGADALTAVTMMFPVFMLLVALATLVSGGMSSLLARLLGAGERETARETVAGAHGLAAVVCALLIAGFLLGGRQMVAFIAGGDEALAATGGRYISILIYCSPAMFFLSLNSDALRCEGRMGLVAAVAVATSLGNIMLNYVLIAMLGFGVAGSAWGTVFAQMFAAGAIVAYRLAAGSPLSFRGLPRTGWTCRWGEFLKLGAPQSLAFLGISLISGAIIAAVHRWGGEGQAATVAAYGIVTRIITFVYLPLLGLTAAMQAITGNNFGASQWQRSNASLRLATFAGLAYYGSVQVLLLAARHRIGFVFVDDPATAAEVARILPVMTMTLFISGPLMVLSAHFQAIGEAGRAAAISLSRTYLFALPLTFLLPFVFGEGGIWFAGPTAELLAALLATIVLWRSWAATGNRFGVFRQAD